MTVLLVLVCPILLLNQVFNLKETYFYILKYTRVQMTPIALGARLIFLCSTQRFFHGVDRVFFLVGTLK